MKTPPCPPFRIQWFTSDHHFFSIGPHEIAMTFPRLCSCRKSPLIWCCPAWLAELTSTWSSPHLPCYFIILKHGFHCVLHRVFSSTTRRKYWNSTWITWTSPNLLSPLSRNHKAFVLMTPGSKWRRTTNDSWNYCKSMKCKLPSFQTNGSCQILRTYACVNNWYP